MKKRPNVRVACVQAAPVYFDLEKTVEKGIGLVEEAAKNGARLVAFPEVWIPGYPLFAWLNAPIQTLLHMPNYRDNALVVGGEHDLALRRAACENGIHVCMGYAERSGGSLYMGQMLISPDGEPLIVRRKVKPTLAERSVFGEGDGSHLKVVETPIGRLGALNCWEHLQPLLKYAMYAQNEQVHTAGWPCLALYREQSYALGREATWAVSQTYALEGQCYVLASTMNATPEVVEMLCDTPEKKAYLAAGGGASMIFGPDGQPLCEPIPHDQEGILYADVDFDAIGIAKTAADPAGHYARPDVARLLLNTAPALRVVTLDDLRQAGGCSGQSCCESEEGGCDGDECSCSDPRQD
jgi:aliphatic nitrilase